MLTALLVVAGLVAAIWLYGVAVERYYRVEVTADARVAVSAADGWPLVLWRYAARGERRRHPVLLIPGMGTNRYSFDLGADGPSMARHLAGAGFEVFVGELRGHGESDHGPKRWGWDLDTLIEDDCRSLLGAVREITGADAVHCVGHSMGGIMLLAMLARGDDGIRAAVTLGAGLDYSEAPSSFRQALWMRPLLKVLPAIPIGLPSQLLAPLSSRVETDAELFNVWLANVDPVIERRMNAIAFNRTSSPILDQLISVLEPGGLRDRRGAPYLPGLRAREDLPPLLMLAGDRDRQTDPLAAEATAGDHPRIAVRRLGPDRGQAEHYGHFDLVMGRNAEAEVFPLVAAHLALHD